MKPNLAILLFGNNLLQDFCGILGKSFFVNGECPKQKVIFKNLWSVFSLPSHVLTSVPSVHLSLRPKQRITVRHFTCSLGQVPADRPLPGQGACIVQQKDFSNQDSHWDYLSDRQRYSNSLYQFWRKQLISAPKTPCYIHKNSIMSTFKIFWGLQKGILLLGEGRTCICRHNLRQTPCESACGRARTT